MNKDKSDLDEAPLISPNVSLPEITVKAVILAIILAVLLAASNAYLALKVGTTVAASIPAAVVSIAVFRLFRRSNVLENNLVQTAASAGEGLAAAATFILPALVILKFWEGFNFWQSAAITMVGGILGVLFSVPLRRVLLSLPILPFPEGTAIGNVLKASASAGTQIKNLFRGGVAGAAVALCQTGFEFVSSYFPLWVKKGNMLFGTTLGFDPVLIGAGYIIGINANLALFLGTISCWLIGVPVLCSIYGLPAGSDHYDMVMNLWDQHIRYIGVGTMMLAGVWTLLTLIKPMIKGVYKTFRKMNTENFSNKIQLRTEKDIPIYWVLSGIAVLVLLAFLFILFSIKSSGLLLTGNLVFGISLIALLAVLILGFLSALICGYLVGLIGSTNTPLSGILIINVLLLSLIIFPLIGTEANLHFHMNQQAAIAIVIFIVTIIGTAAVITNENIQDLKAGKMVGATPWKQQIMMIIGVIVSAIAIAPVLDLLFNAYGMGGVFPHPGMNPEQMLPAPQAGLLAALSQAVIGHSLPWPMLMTGMIIAVICIGIDALAKRKGYRLPVLAVGLGIYLPPEIIIPSVLGGLIHYLAARRLSQQTKALALSESEQKKTFKEVSEKGVLLACGFVAGSALIGVVLAIPFVIEGNSDVLKLVSDNFLPIANILGLVITVLLLIWLYRTASSLKKN